MGWPRLGWQGRQGEDAALWRPGIKLALVGYVLVASLQFGGLLLNEHPRAPRLSLSDRQRHPRLRVASPFDERVWSINIGDVRPQPRKAERPRLSEWFDWKPSSGRLESIQRAITKRELLVAHDRARVIGFIHYVMHENIIDGGLNSFMTAFYVSPSNGGRGVGTLLLEGAIADSLAMGAVGAETSTLHTLAKKLYERHHFKQTMGDVGEVFLELDIPEYLRSKMKGNLSKD